MSIISPTIQGEKKEISYPLLAQGLIKENGKDLLKLIRVAFKWTQYFFPNLESYSSIEHLVAFVKQGEDSFTFSTFGQSVLKTADHIKKKTQRKLHELRVKIFDLIFDFFKLCKSLKTYEIINFGKDLFSTIGVIANIAASSNSLQAVFNETKLLFNLELPNNKKFKVDHSFYLYEETKTDQYSEIPKDIKVLRHILKIAQSIAKLVLGILFLLYLEFALSTLIIDTIVVVSHIAFTSFEKIYVDPIKKEKEKLSAH